MPGFCAERCARGLVGNFRPALDSVTVCRKRRRHSRQMRGVGWKRYAPRLGVLVALVGISFVAALWSRPKRREMVLIDGTRIEYLGGTFGTNHWNPATPALTRWIIPTRTPPGREGQNKRGPRLPRASARRLASALGYHLIVLTGLQFALARDL